VAASAIADIYISLGDVESAFEWLAKAQAIRAPGLIFAAVAPLAEKFRSDARLNSLLRNLGFA
jgi:hypothetical protein